MHTRLATLNYFEIPALLKLLIKYRQLWPRVLAELADEARADVHGIATAVRPRLQRMEDLLNAQ